MMMAFLPASGRFGHQLALSALVGGIAAVAYFYFLRTTTDYPGIGDGQFARVAFFAGLIVTALAYAWWKGGSPERIVASVFAARTVLDPVLHQVMPVRFTSADPTHTLLDLGLAIAAVSVTLRANRHWPIPVAALCLFPVYFHFWEAFRSLMPPLMYGALQVAWTYPPLFILLAGIARHEQRKHRNGVDVSWVPAAPRDDRRALR